jgi:hypothetical protein
MKKQIATLAAVMMLSNVAMAKGLSASAVNLSSQGIDKVLSAADSISKVSINIVGGTEDGIESVRKAIEAEGKAQTKKGNIAQKGMGASSGLVAFSVESVEFVVEKGEQLTRATLTGSHSGSKMVVETVEKNVAVPVANFTDTAAVSAGKAVVSAASTIFKAGRNVLVGTTSSGLVLIQETADAVAQGTKGQSTQSSNTLIGSFGKSADAMGSELVKGFRK